MNFSGSGYCVIRKGLPVTSMCSIGAVAALILSQERFMIVFCSDLDNTLIYSYKHEIGDRKICVELYQGREISFMTAQSYRMLKEVTEKTLFVPVTTRTMEQYERIDLGIGIPPYALICNGGVLLVKGREDDDWYRESLAMVSGCRKELAAAEKMLNEDQDRSFEVRNIRELFLFTKSDKPERSAAALKKSLDLTLVDVFCNGVKVYVVPKQLSKGNAVRRFRKRVDANMVAAAGDSEFDVPMLKEADAAIAPAGLAERFDGLKGAVLAQEGVVFSDYMLEYMQQLIGGTKP